MSTAILPGSMSEADARLLRAHREQHMFPRCVDYAYRGWLDLNAVTQLDVDLVHHQATGRPADSARLPVYVAPFNRRTTIPAPSRPLIDRETWIALGFVLFALLVLLLVSIDAHSRFAALFV